MSQDPSFAAENKWSRNGFGEPVSRDGGKFTRDESEAVRRAVEDYCALKQISTSRLCSECDHKAELKGAWMEIAKRVPHRTVQSVYRHGLRQLHPFKRGPWSDAECLQLEDLVARHGKKWAAIQAKLNRSSDSIRDKYREMSSDYVKGRWKDPETELLKRLIREQLNADPNADIKELGKMVQDQNIAIPWTVISKKMSKRSRLSCFKKWQKLTGLTGIEPPASPNTKPSVPKPKEASTAGAAVAAVAAAVAAAVTNYIATTEEDLDTYLLTEVMSHSNGQEMDWNVVRGVVNAEQRWYTLIEEWQTEDPQAEELLQKLSLAEMAQHLLERKQQSVDSKMAAATVEAVELPEVPVETREV